MRECDYQEVSDKRKKRKKNNSDNDKANGGTREEW